MKQRLCYAIMLFCLFNTAYATEDSWKMSINAENMDTGEAASISIQTDDFLYGGLSLNYIKSTTVIQYDSRKTISPLYLFMGLQYPAKISPFIEGAVDLPETIFDEIFDNEENTIDETDYYLAAGLNVALNNRLSLSFYARKYVFKFNDTPTNTMTKVRLDSYGAALRVQF